MYLISSHKKGVSSCQLSRDIKVCQATAWYMLQKIRKLYGQDDAESFVGDVEYYEVYIGGTQEKRPSFDASLLYFAFSYIAVVKFSPIHVHYHY